MRHSLFSHSLFSLSLAAHVIVAAALVATSGCSGPDVKTTVDSMGNFGNETAKAKDSIDSTLQALAALVGAEPGEIKARVDAYAKSVAALDGQANVVRGHAEKMKASGDEFFKEWEGSETVSTARRTELRESYARIKEEMAIAKDGFTPFLASLKDIQSYVSLDPSTKGINSVASLVKQAKESGAEVKSHIDAVLLQVNSVRGMLSTKP